VHGTVSGYSRFLALAHGTFRAPGLGENAEVSMELLGAMNFDVGAVHTPTTGAGRSVGT
jgi:hypothetical protein